MQNRWSLVLLVVSSAAGQTVLADQHERPRTVEVLLTTAPTLPAPARQTMMKEAAEIWREQGVAIEWMPPTVVRPPAANRLRALVIQRPLSSVDRREPLAVGELMRPLNGHVVALISIACAQQLMASMRGRTGYELIAVDERRLGLILGRALAHEIGHYLLGTHTHARNGLMRPGFSAFEFTDPRPSMFALDAAASAWLRRANPAEKFAYAR